MYDTCLSLSPLLHLKWSPWPSSLWLDLELFPTSLWLRNIVLCVCTPLCIHSSGISSISLLPRLGCCTLWGQDCRGSCLKNFKKFKKLKFFYFLQIYAQTWDWLSAEILLLFFKWTSMCSPYWMNLCTLQSMVQEGSLVFIPPLAFILLKIILFIHLSLVALSLGCWA